MLRFAFSHAAMINALIGSVALPVGIALLFSWRHAVSLARLYLGLNLLGEALLIAAFLVFRSYVLLPRWSAGVTLFFMLLCFYFTLQIPSDPKT
jgi:hypothetical protein